MAEPDDEASLRIILAKLDTLQASLDAYRATLEAYRAEVVQRVTELRSRVDDHDRDIDATAQWLGRLSRRKRQDRDRDR